LLEVKGFLVYFWGGFGLFKAEHVMLLDQCFVHSFVAELAFGALALGCSESSWGFEFDLL
jgi:hypothetical protein